MYDQLRSSSRESAAAPGSHGYLWVGGAPAGKKLLKNLDEINNFISKLKTKRRQTIHTKKSLENSVLMAKMKSILKYEKEKAKKKLSDGKTLSLDELRLALDQDDEYLKI